MKHIAWFGVLLAACTDFSSIERDICGNGLLEVGEDCDSSAPSCVSCSVSCASVADCPTTDYACGVDGLCHAPGGTLALPHTAGTFEADELRISDLDADGLGDALGITRTSLVIAHGDATAQLDQITSFVTPTQTGPAAFGDLDRDGATDVTMTTPDGLVSYTSEFGELTPVPINTEFIDQVSGKPLDVRRMFFVGSNIISAIVVDPMNGNGAIAIADNIGPQGQITLYSPCAIRAGALSGDALEKAKIDVYNVSRRGDNAIDTVLAITTMGAGRKLCVVSIHRDAPNLFTPNVIPQFTYVDITPIPAASPMMVPVLADIDIDADRCPGLVMQDGGLSALVYWEGEMLSGRCTLLPPNNSPQNPRQLQPVGAPLNSILVGRAPVDPPEPLIAADALVTNEGVYPNLLGAYFFNVYKTTRTITQIAIGDFDGDLGQDVAFASQGEEDLDLLLRVPDEAGFNLYRVDTATGVTTLTAGDYDGNAVDDLAYSESLDTYDRLMVVYGTKDRPLEPQSVGSFREILRVDRVSVRDTVDYLGIAEDLVVFQPPVPGGTLKRPTLLHGSPQRTMLSYFDPRVDNLRKETVFRGSVIGDFAADTGEPFTDLIALAPPSLSADTIDSPVRAWRVPGTPDGLDATATSGIAMEGLIDCSLGNTNSLCLDVARYLAFPVGANHDVVIGVDKSGRAIMVDPYNTTQTTVGSTPLTNLVAKIPDKAIPRSLYTADLDGDGSVELVVAFAPASSADAGAVLTCTMANGVPQVCEDLAPAVKAAAMTAGYPVTHCYDAAVGKLSHRDATSVADPSSDIIVACRGDGTSLFRVHRGPAGQVIDRLATVAAPVTAIRAGDVTGDHLDDIVLLEGDTVRSLVVFPQCSSRDLACIGAGK